MKIVLNDKEIIFYLASLLNYRYAVKDIEMDEREIAETIIWSVERKAKLNKFRAKIKDRIYNSVESTLRNYINAVNDIVAAHRKKDIESLKTNLDYVIEKLGENKILDEYMKSSFNGFCKNPGLQIDPNGSPVRRKNFKQVTDNCIIRNTVGNENILTEKIDNKLPFWFIDSGYTNFIETNKKWHRIVCNHIHSNANFLAPVDRLGSFKSFPRQWRRGGDRILVIEPGEFSASIFHIDPRTWRSKIEEELRKYTDKKIIFREKISKKERIPLFDHLLNEDYYCLININSNAATEAVWAGVPVITLDKHITNSIAKDKISDINNLYRGSLSNWLSVLSYSQFTYEELMDGTAVDIIKKYHV